VVASHGGVIVQSMLRFLAVDLSNTGERAWFSPENASITEWRWGSNPYTYDSLEWELVRFNDHAHLAGRPALAGR
jgi:broad specificity phosphatase PhoE